MLNPDNFGINEPFPPGENSILDIMCFRTFDLLDLCFPSVPAREADRRTCLPGGFMYATFDMLSDLIGGGGPGGLRI